MSSDNAAPSRTDVVPRGEPSHLSEYYDLSTFMGRLSYNWSFFSPLNLRFGSEALAEANETLRADSGASLEQRRQALVVRAACAPAGEMLPMPFRSCGWALGGTPTIAFMVYNALTYPKSLWRIFLGHGLNQTHLAGCTYCNRGSVGAASMSSIAKAYVISVGLGTPIAYIAATAAMRWKLLRPLARFAPYPGVALANFVACAAMRQDDLTDGIPVSAAADGAASSPVSIGTSCAAGWAAVRDTAFTRLCMPIGNFLVVPSLLYLVQRWRGPSAVLGLGVATQVGVTAAVFSLWLPFSASLFPPIGVLPVEALEAELRDTLDKDIRTVTYQRGV